MRNFLRKFDKFEEVVLVSSLVANVLIVFIQVIMRYFFNTSLAWSEELSRVQRILHQLARSLYD